MTRGGGVGNDEGGGGAPGQGGGGLRPPIDVIEAVTYPSVSCASSLASAEDAAANPSNRRDPLLPPLVSPSSERGGGGGRLDPFDFGNDDGANEAGLPGPSSSSSDRRRPPPPPVQYLFGRYEVEEECEYLHVSDAEALLSAIDRGARPSPRRVVLKLMKHEDDVLAELESRIGLDDGRRRRGGGHDDDDGCDDDDDDGGIVPIHRCYVDDSETGAGDALRSYGGPIEPESHVRLTDELKSCLEGRIASREESSTVVRNAPYPYVLVLEHYNRTLEDALAHAHVDLSLARKIFRDVVSTLIRIHTKKYVHGDLKPRSIVRVGDRWKIADFHASVRMGEPLDDRERIGYVPPEVASAIVRRDDDEDEDDDDPNEDEAMPSSVATYSYDLWSLGCVLYHLAFGSSLWSLDHNGRMSEEDVEHVSNWTHESFLTKANSKYPPSSRTDDRRSVLDLLYNLLSPTSELRSEKFPLGILSVHQHPFLVGRPLENDALADMEGKQLVVSRDEEDRNDYVALKRKLTLEDEWELSRLKDVLLTGLFEDVDVPAPTSFVILKRRLERKASSLSKSNPNDGDDDRPPPPSEERFREAMKWLQNMDELGASVSGALDGDVSSIGTFWGTASSEHMFEGDYMYFYFVDEITGRPVLGPADDAEDDAGKGRGGRRRYPAEIRTWSDVVPKLLPMMHATMRAAALRDGAAGLVRVFGCDDVADGVVVDDAPFPPARLVTDDLRAKIEDLKDERHTSPFGALADDASKLLSSSSSSAAAAGTAGAAVVDRGKVFKSETSARFRSRRSLVRFVEEKGLRNSTDDGTSSYAGLKRYSDEDGRALWTTVTDPDELRRRVRERAEERLNEEGGPLVTEEDREESLKLKRSLEEEREAARGLERSLDDARGELARTKDEADRLRSNLDDAKKQLERKRRELETERAAGAECNCCIS